MHIFSSVLFPTSRPVLRLPSDMKMLLVHLVIIMLFLHQARVHVLPSAWNATRQAPCLQLCIYLANSYLTFTTQFLSSLSTVLYH